MTSLLFQAEFNASSEFSSDKTMLCSAAVFFCLIHSCRGKGIPIQPVRTLKLFKVTRELVLGSIFQLSWLNPFVIAEVYLCLISPGFVPFFSRLYFRTRCAEVMNWNSHPKIISLHFLFAVTRWTFSYLEHKHLSPKLGNKVQLTVSKSCSELPY